MTQIEKAISSFGEPLSSSPLVHTLPAWNPTFAVGKQFPTAVTITSATCHLKRKQAVEKCVDVYF